MARTSSSAVPDPPTSRSSMSPREKKFAGFPRTCAPSTPRNVCLAIDSARARCRSASSFTRTATRAWVAHTNADVVAEIDLESWKIVRLLEAGREPDGMAYSALDVEKD